MKELTIELNKNPQSIDIGQLIEIASHIVNSEPFISFIVSFYGSCSLLREYHFYSLINKCKNIKEFRMYVGEYQTSKNYPKITLLATGQIIGCSVDKFK